MEVRHYTEIPPETVEDGAKGVCIRWLITEKMGARNFVMRHFEIGPQGFTPQHQHAWEHEVFILSGEGTLAGAKGEKGFRAGDFIFVQSGEMHQFRNAGAEPVRMLCLIPARERCSL